MSPRFDLAEVLQLVAAYRSGQPKVWFNARKASILYVDHVLRCGELRAERYILDGLQLLRPTDFASSTMMQWDQVADEYGLAGYLNHNWYIKFYIEPDEDKQGESILTEVSFHPVEEPLKLITQQVLMPTLSENERPPWRQSKK